VFVPIENRVRVVSEAMLRQFRWAGLSWPLHLENKREFSSPKSGALLRGCALDL
jgi:hypothetical protein